MARKITNIEDLLALIYYAENNNGTFGVFDPKDVRDSAIELIKNSKKYRHLKDADLSDWTLFENIKPALELISAEELNTTTGEPTEATPQAAELAKQARKTAKESVQSFVKQNQEAEKKRSSQEKKEKPIVQAKAPEEKRKVETKKIVYAKPITPPVSVRVEEKLIEKLVEAKKDPEFLNKFVEIASDPKNLPLGVDQKTAKLVAAVAATDIIKNKLPILQLSQNQVVPLPNIAAAEAALLNNTEVVKTAFKENSQEARKTMVLGFTHDAAWQESMRHMANVYFQTVDSSKASTLLYGDKNQEFEITPSQSEKDNLQIDVVANFNHSQEIADLLKQPPIELNRSLLQNFESNVSLRADWNTLFQNTSNLTRGIVDLFGKPTPTAEIPIPSMDQLQVLNYLKVMPQLTPGLFSDVQLAAFAVEKLPFGLPAGQLTVNAGLFNGVSFGFTPATAVAGEAAGTAATTVAATAVAGEAAAVGTAAGAAAGEVAVTTATTAAAGTGLGAAFGSIVPLLGTAIGAIGGFIATKLPKIKEWLSKNSGKLATGLIGGGLLGLMLGNPFVAVGGFALGIPTAFAAGIGPKSMLARFVNGLGSILTGAVLPGIAAPLVSFLIAFPIVVAVIMFVINSGAYVVPPQTNSITGQISQGLVAAGTCPVVGGAVISTSSYNPETEAGHGSNSYWNVVGGACTRFDIPIPGMWAAGCKGPTPEEDPQGQNICLNSSPTCPYYGFATDFIPPTGATSGVAIALPTVCDPGTDCAPLNWTLEQSFWNCGGSSNPASEPPGCSNPAGKGAIFNADGNGHKWRLYLNHIDNLTVENGQTYSSGTIVGETAEIVGPHLHVELNIDGTPVRPDFMCNGSQSTQTTFPSCFQYGDEAWTGNQKSLVESSINYLVQKHPRFVSKICSTGQKVTISRAFAYCNSANECEDPTSPPSTRRNAGSSPGSLTLYNALFEGSDQDGITRVITHELAHQIEFFNVNYYKNYLNQVPGKEKYLPGYRFSNGANKNWEDFAETAATYLDYLELHTPSIVPNLQSQYPLHFDFAKRTLFEE